SGLTDAKEPTRKLAQAVGRRLYGRQAGHHSVVLQRARSFGLRHDKELIADLLKLSEPSMRLTGAGIVKCCRTREEQKDGLRQGCNNRFQLLKLTSARASADPRDTIKVELLDKNARTTEGGHDSLGIGSEMISRAAAIYERDKVVGDRLAPVSRSKHPPALGCC